MRIKYHIINTILLSISVLGTGFGQDQLLKLEDIWGSPKLYSRTAGGFNSMQDGEHYSNTVAGEEGTSIVRYNFQTGLASDTLLRPGQLVFEGKRIDFSDYQFSTDETKLLLTVDQEAIYRHSTKEDYFILDRKTGKLSKITTGGKAMYGTFSPAGDKLAYVRDNNLFYHDLSTGKEVVITTDGSKNAIINGATDWVYEEEFSMDVAFAWSGNGEQIAYYRFDESRVKEFNLTYYGELYPKEEKYKYPKAGEENSSVSLNIFSLKNRKTVRIAETGKEWEYIPRIAWTKNPEILSFQRSNRHQNVLELVLYNTATQNTQVVLHEENSSFIEITDDLTFLDNGKQFIWTSSKSGFNHIYLHNLDGKLAKQITSGNYDVTRYYGFDEKAGIFYYQSAERSPLERHLYAITLKGKKKNLSEVAGIHNAEFSAGMHYFADTYSSLGSPHTCTLNDSKDGKIIRTLTDNSAVRKALNEYRLGRCDTLSCITAEGTRLYGWMITPPDFEPSKKYPVLMHVYGGPGVQTVTNDWDGPNYLWHQLLAQKGYIVVSFDNRGTPGRGLAFANCIYKDMGNIEVQDQLSVLDFLKTKSYVDAQRIGVWGWSFGGYMSSLLLTKGKGQFKAGIAVAPVTNWKYYDSIYTERYLQTPQENPNGYDDNSPINFAKDLQGSFLLVHGSTDDNVHMQNTMDFVTALVKANKPFDLFIYPNKNHGIGGGNTRLHLYSKMTNFILENL